MAYTYTKLGEVELVETSVEPNLLIEEGGEIKRISAQNVAVPQVKADWEETDPSSPAFILNKPEVGGASGANVVTYTIISGALQLDGVAATAQEVVDEWNNGSILRINETDSSGGSVVSINYTLASGVISNATLCYFIGSGSNNITI